MTFSDVVTSIACGMRCHYYIGQLCRNGMGAVILGAPLVQVMSDVGWAISASSLLHHQVCSVTNGAVVGAGILPLSSLKTSLQTKASFIGRVEQGKRLWPGRRQHEQVAHHRYEHRPCHWRRAAGSSLRG